MTAQLHAARAVRAYAAMRRHFLRRDGLYRRDGRARPPGAAAHLWPTARAFVAAVDLLGLSPELLLGFDAESAVGAHLRALEAYWDDSGDQPAYASDVIGSRLGGDRYYDDNAWVGLGLCSSSDCGPAGAMPSGPGACSGLPPADGTPAPTRPAPVACSGWSRTRPPGARARATTIATSSPTPPMPSSDCTWPRWRWPPAGRAGAELHARAHDMYTWVNVTLDAGRDTGAPATGLFFDKLRGDGTIDETLWTYNQGSMIGANVLLARQADRGAPYLARAEAIAAKALRHYSGSYESRPAAFNAILFRNLLGLHAATADEGLRRGIRHAMSAYAEAAWATRRDRHDRFHFARGGRTLLDQSAMVQVYALLAWDPRDYGALA